MLGSLPQELETLTQLVYLHANSCNLTIININFSHLTNLVVRTPKIVIILIKKGLSHIYLCFI